MNQSEHQHSIANPYIKKYWVIENRSTINKVTKPMISDGYLEILIIEGIGASCKLGNNQLNLPCGIYMTGQFKGKSTLCLMPCTKMHFLKLHHWAFPLITDYSLIQSINQIIPFSELNSSLEKKLKQFHPSSQMNRIVEALTAALYDKSEFNQNSNIIHKASSRLLESETDFRTTKMELLSDLKISDRTLENKFKQFVGLTPKQFSITVKLRGIVEDLSHNRCDSSLTSMALENGFFDQSHFIRCFRSLFDQPPGKFEFQNYFIPNSDESFRYYTI